MNLLQRLREWFRNDIEPALPAPPPLPTLVPPPAFLARPELLPCSRCGAKTPRQDLLLLVDEQTDRTIGRICKPCAEVSELADSPQLAYVGTLVPGERVRIKVNRIVPRS